MTYDPLQGTDLARAALPESMTGFGIAEIATIVASQETPEAARSREIFGIAANYASDDIVLAGSSALTARGLLSSTAGEGHLLSSAALLRTAVSTCVRWTRIGLLSESTPRVVFVLQSPDVTAIVEPNAVLTWWTAFADPSQDVAALVGSLVEQRLGTHTPAVLVDVRSLDASVGNVVIAKDSNDALIARTNVDAEGVGGEEHHVASDGLVDLLAAYVPVVSASA